jgi:hypothetical protein
MNHLSYAIVSGFFPKTRLLAPIIAATLLILPNSRAEIDSGGGFEALGNQTVWCSVGGAFATDPVAIGNLSNFSGKIAVIYTMVSQVPPNEDVDGDGLHDDWETQYFGSTGVAPGSDSDGDGATNLMEFLAGTNPTLPSSKLKLTTGYANGALSITMDPTTAGREYRMHFSADLQSWAFVRSLNGDGTPKTHTFTPSIDDPQFPTRSNKSKYFIRIQINKP